MSQDLFELDVRLRHIAPPIWRTIQVPGVITLEDLHFALQAAMGWTNSHLHQFRIGTATYGMTDVDDAPETLEDERDFALSALARAGDRFVYEYDFGDGWDHDVVVTKVTEVAKATVPRCTAGARACPPEDCGGPPGYEHLLESSAAERLAAENFALPKKGRDLREDMMALKVMLMGDEAVDEDPTALPRQLVEAVLALEPMQRASLAAVIAGSLASELLDVRETVVKSRKRR
jgi:Plasmid pRiA4b ORF-3-like protein